MGEPEQIVPEPDKQQYEAPWGPKPLPITGAGIAGSVSGVIGILFSFVPILGGVASVLAMVLGVIGIYQTSRKTRHGLGIAIAGFAFGFIGIVIFSLTITGTSLSRFFF
jgi:hypothetical protein